VLQLHGKVADRVMLRALCCEQAHKSIRCNLNFKPVKKAAELN